MSDRTLRTARERGLIDDKQLERCLAADDPADDEAEGYRTQQERSDYEHDGEHLASIAPGRRYFFENLIRTGVPSRAILSLRRPSR